jgi:cytochrome c nitrite reductase small subunit
MTPQHAGDANDEGKDCAAWRGYLRVIDGAPSRVERDCAERNWYAQVLMRRKRSSLAERAAIGTAGLVSAAVIGMLFGALGGAAGYTARYAEATSYLSDKPETCINCHIMNEQYNGWSSSSHASRATCNDCHVPHDSILSKYYVKSEHGYRHSKRFTLQNFHEPIRINDHSRGVVIDNCIRCHEAMTHEIRTAARGDQVGAAGVSGGVDCIHCHASVAHGATR